MTTTTTRVREAFDKYRVAYERCYHAGCRRSVTDEAEFKSTLADYLAALEDAKSEIPEATK